MGLIPGLILNIYKSARILTSKHISLSLYHGNFPDIKQHFCMIRILALLVCQSVKNKNDKTILSVSAHENYRISRKSVYV